MKLFSFFVCFLLAITFSSNAQQSLKPGYITKVPVTIKNCGALYTFDSISLRKKKFILLTDFQNLGIISIGGKQIKLLLTDSKTEEKINISTYTGAGYTVVLSYRTISQNSNPDIETGTLKISKGNDQLTIKVRGQSGCDESKQEENGK